MTDYVLLDEDAAAELADTIRRAFTGTPRCRCDGDLAVAVIPDSLNPRNWTVQPVETHLGGCRVAEDTQMRLKFAQIIANADDPQGDPA